MNTITPVEICQAINNSEVGGEVSERVLVAHFKAAGFSDAEIVASIHDAWSLGAIVPSFFDKGGWRPAPWSES